jgi:hypothetical protein
MSLRETLKGLALPAAERRAARAERDTLARMRRERDATETAVRRAAAAEAERVKHQIYWRAR